MDIFSFGFVSFAFLTKHQCDKWLKNLIECSRETGIWKSFFFFIKKNCYSVHIIPFIGHLAPWTLPVITYPSVNVNSEIYFLWEIFRDYFGLPGHRNQSLQQHFEHPVCAHNILWVCKISPLPTVSFFSKKLLQTRVAIKRLKQVLQGVNINDKHLVASGIQRRCYVY